MVIYFLKKENSLLKKLASVCLITTQYGKIFTIISWGLQHSQAPLINVEKKVFYRTIYRDKKKLDQPQDIDIVKTLVLTPNSSTTNKQEKTLPLNT